VRRARRAPPRIRAAGGADARAIAGVMRSAVRGLARGAHAPDEIAAWSSLPPLYHRWAMTAGGERYVVAAVGGRIAGYGARRGKEITALFVRPAAAASGIGSALLARLERDARAEGLASVRADAALGAVGFYAARGFRVGRALRVPLPGGSSLAARVVTKRLAAAPARALARARRRVRDRSR
jgi:putative acetyltransferase